MTETIIILAVVLIALAAFNMWSAIKSRNIEKDLKARKSELERLQQIIEIRERAANVVMAEAQRIKDENDLTSQEVRPVRAMYVVSESDEYRYNNEKLMAKGVKKQLTAALADSLAREFGAPEEGQTPEGRKIFSYNFVVKRV
ncbi:MAG: hypothetical protein IK114_14200 [Fibrobacter sp.]|nr:hypothetical protein [Fibrobacter sp.]